MALQAQVKNLLGVHFIPTDDELLYYLSAKARGEPLPSDAVVEKVLYGENATPWQIFSDDDPWEITERDPGKKGAKKVIYVLTKLSNMGARKKSRTAGCGTWEGQTKPREIVNDREEIIGSKKMLTFSLKGGSKSKANGHWIMHEYALDGVSLRGIGSTVYVICKITMDYSKCSMKKEFENPTINHQVVSKRKVEEESSCTMNDNTTRSIIEPTKYLKREGGFLSTTSSQGYSGDQMFDAKAENLADKCAGETSDHQKASNVPIYREKSEFQLVNVVENQLVIDGEKDLPWESLADVVDLSGFI